MASQSKNLNFDSDDENDTLAELNEFLDGDHAGQRLADFLMRKRGAPRIKDSVFAGCPLPKFKFTMNLKRSITPETAVNPVPAQSKSPLEELSQVNKNNIENITHKKASTSAVTSIAKCAEYATKANECDLPKPSIVDSPKNKSPTPAMREVRRRSGSLSPIYNSPRPRSGCSDKLRRSAIKRRSLFAHRRQLLSEFEVTPMDFEPQVCSTPAVLIQPILPTQDNQQLFEDPGSSEDSECLMRNLNRCDDHLRNLIEEAIDRTLMHAKEQSILGSPHTPSPPTSRPSSPGSARRRTYTVEKGSMPGQVVLTPKKFLNDSVMSMNAKSDKLRTPVVRLRNISKVGVQSSVKSAMHVSSTTNEKSTTPVGTPCRMPLERSLVLNSPLLSNDPSQLHNEEIIPETQDVPQSPHENLTQLLNKKELPMVVIPFYQTFNGPPTTPTHLTFAIEKECLPENIPNVNTTCSNKSVLLTDAVLKNQSAFAKSTSPIECENTTKAKNCVKETHVNKSIQTSVFAGANTVDNFEADLITDDESMENSREISMDEVVKNNSAAPLNLATGINGPIETRRHRRRKSIPKPHQADEPNLSGVKKDCNPDVVINLRHEAKIGGLNRKKIMPLNKAPNTPINGEKFAFELARMTNYEILDLRKRNSLGKIFPVCGRKSIVEEKILKEKRLNLEKHIDFEMKRRNLSTQNITERQDETDITVTQSEHEKTALLPAPLGFADASLNQEGRPNLSLETLKMRYKRGRTSRKSIRRTYNLPMSETLKHYMEATKNLQERKKKLKDNNKRNLYTKGNSDSEETQSSSPEKNCKMQSNIEIVPSPPGTLRSNNVRFSQLHIVPPPPPESFSPPPPLDDFAPPPPCQFSAENNSLSETELQTERKIQSLSKKKIKNCIIDKQAGVSIESFVNHPVESISNNVVHEVNTTNNAVVLSPMRKSSMRRQSARLQSEDCQKRAICANNTEIIDKPNSTVMLPAKERQTKHRQSAKIQCEVEEQITSNAEEQTPAVYLSDTGIKEPLSVYTPIAAKELNKSSVEKNLVNFTATNDVNEALPMRRLTSKRRQSAKVQEVEDERKSNVEETPAINSSDTEIMEPLRVCIPIVEEDQNKSIMETNSVNVTGITEVSKALPTVESVVAHSTTETPTPTMYDDQPSTSQAAMNRSKVSPAAPVSENDGLFKKPTMPAPKRGRKKKQELSENEIELQQNDVSLRRSKRGHVPLKNTWSFQNKDPTSLFQVLYQKQMDLCLARSQKRLVTLKNKSGLSSECSELSTHYNCQQPVCTSTPLNPSEFQPPGKRKRGSKYIKPSLANDPQFSGLGDSNTRTSGIEPLSTTRESNTETEATSEAFRLQPQLLSIINEDEVFEPQATSKRTKKGKKEVRKVRTKKKKNDQQESSTEKQSAPVQELNSIIDQLKAASFTEDDVAQSGEAKDMEPSSVANNNAISKTAEVQPVNNGQSNCSRNELIAWLKGFSGNTEGDVDNDMFFGMHISTRGNLVFMDLDGIDYAFYDTEEKGSLGYMRFKPKQIRPPKRAKTYNLHFIVLTGEFMIGTTTQDKKNERANFVPGDMIAINKGSRYTIENLSNDISILMVFKK